MTQIKISANGLISSIVSIGVGVALHYAPPVARKVISPIMLFISGAIS